MASVDHQQFYQATMTEHLSVVIGMAGMWRAAGEAARLFACALQDGHKIMICGNGGSAADAQHMAAELSGRFKLNRKSLAAVSLTTDTSVITAIGNDYGYDEVFSRQVSGLGKRGDVLVAISTSGMSANVLKAANVARELGVCVVAFVGMRDCDLGDVSDLVLSVPSSETARIQEAHELLIHIICEIVELHLCV